VRGDPKKAPPLRPALAGTDGDAPPPPDEDEEETKDDGPPPPPAEPTRHKVGRCSVRTCGSLHFEGEETCNRCGGVVVDAE
jgi:hypothetical protein